MSKTVEEHCRKVQLLQSFNNVLEDAKSKEKHFLSPLHPSNSKHARQPNVTDFKPLESAVADKTNAFYNQAKNPSNSKFKEFYHS